MNYLVFTCRHTFVVVVVVVVVRVVHIFIVVTLCKHYLTNDGEERIMVLSREERVNGLVGVYFLLFLATL